MQTPAKSVVLAVIHLLVICLILAASAYAGGPTITITDSYGRRVTLPCPPRRAVVLNSDVAEIISVLGAGEAIIGVSDTVDFPPSLGKKAKVGKSFTPSVERIFELNPDVVFAYGKFLKAELARQIEGVGIPLVYIDCYKIDTMPRDIEILGRIFKKETKAEAYIDIIQKYQGLIESRLKKLNPKEKPLVYLEGYTEYSSVSQGSGGDQLVTLAGGVNIAADEPVPYPKVSPEWVVAKDPQMIVKALGTSVPAGYGITNMGPLEQKRKEIMNRPAWGGLTAVKEGRVYLIASEIYTSPRFVVGLAYFAKWFHPDLFGDLDPEAIHREILELHDLSLKGVWVYP